MREIKFRAWDKHFKVMRDVTWIDFEEGAITYNWIFGDSASSIGRAFLDIELMQSTDLYDSVNNEIWEGYIVELYNNLTGDREVHEVVYSAPSFGLKRNGNIISLWGIDVDLVKLKVIGNVYETPELLKVKNERK